MLRLATTLRSLLLLATLAFAGGGLFLLFLLVPAEQKLQTWHWSQANVDRTLTALIVLWVILCLWLTVLYHQRAPWYERHGRYGFAYGLPLLSTAAAAVMLVGFLHTDLSVISNRRGAVQSAGQRFTFGPYPDTAMLQQLKQEGYSGIITLLNPVVPFEKTLLEQETRTGKALGLEVDSFPMLPWITDNADVLAKIKALVATNQRRYYVHCYLGKHRAILVEQALSGNAVTSVQPGPLPAALERGPLTSYASGQLLVGPLPTDDELFLLILGHKVTEVVSVIDASDSANQTWQDKLTRLNPDYGVRVSLYPLNPAHPDPQTVQSLARYLQAADHKVYVAGIRLGNWSWALDAALGGGAVPTGTLSGLSKFERGQLTPVEGKWLVGPLPTEDELVELRAAGVRDVVALLNSKSANETLLLKQEQASASLYGITLHHIETPPAPALPTQAVRAYLQGRSGPVYIHLVLTDQRSAALAQQLSGV